MAETNKTSTPTADASVAFDRRYATSGDDSTPIDISQGRLVATLEAVLPGEGWSETTKGTWERPNGETTEAVDTVFGRFTQIHPADTQGVEDCTSAWADVASRIREKSGSGQRLGIAVESRGWAGPLGGRRQSLATFRDANVMGTVIYDRSSEGETEPSVPSLEAVTEIAAEWHQQWR